MTVLNTLQIPGLGSVSAKQATDWISSHSPEELATAVQQYNINPADIVNAVNTAKGTNYTLQDFYSYTGLPQSSTGSAANTATSGGSSGGTLNNIANNSNTTGTTGGLPNPYEGSAVLNVPGLGVFTPQQVVEYINTHTPADLAQIVNEYGIDPAALAAAYNAGAGTNYGVEDAYRYLGLPVPQRQKIPENKYPKTESSSTSQGFTGVDWDSPLGRALLPILISQASSLPELAKKFSPTLQGYYSSLLRSALGPDAFQGTLNSLASRGILNSSIASNALSNLAKGIAENIGQQAYKSFLAGLAQQMQIPQALANIANLGRVTRTSTVSKGTTTNELAPYQLMASMLNQ